MLTPPPLPQHVDGRGLVGGRASPHPTNRARAGLRPLLRLQFADIGRESGMSRRRAPQGELDEREAEAAVGAGQHHALAPGGAPVVYGLDVQVTAILFLLGTLKPRHLVGASVDPVLCLAAAGTAHGSRCSPPRRGRRFLLRWRMQS